LVDYDESNRLLNELGCTALQAKIYLALLASEKVTVKTLANQADVARAEVYRILNELQEKKLVQKIIAAPIEFRAIAMSDCLAFLLDYKKREILRLQSKAAKVLQKFKEEKTVRVEEPNFLLIRRKKQYLDLAVKLIVEAKESIDVITTLNRFNALRVSLEKYFVERANNGVKMRFMMEKTENKQVLKEHQKLMMKYPLISFRYTRVGEQPPMIIFDRKKATIVTSLEELPFESPILFSTSPIIIRALGLCYDTMWEKAAEADKIYP